MHVVREEALLVQHDAQSLCGGVDGHWFAVLVSVQLDDGVEAVAKRVAVCGETDDGEEEGSIGLRLVCAADLEDFWGVAGVDGITRGGTGVAGEDGEVGAGDGEGGTTIVSVSRNTLVKTVVDIAIERHTG